MATTPRFNKGICFWVTTALILLVDCPPQHNTPVRAQEEGLLSRILSGQLGNNTADKEPAPQTSPDPDPDPEHDETQPQGKDHGMDTIHVSRTGTVEMHVADQPLAVVLEILSLQSRRNIIATPTVTGTVTAHLYGVTFEEALDAILVANQAGYRQVGSFIYVYTNEELAEIIAAETPPVTRVLPLYYISARDALAVVQPMLSEGGTAVGTPEPTTGLGSGAEDGGADSMAHQDYLVVRDLPDVLDNIEDILHQVDVRPQQVLVEATILGVSLNEENSLGVDFTVVGGVDLELLGSTSTAVTNLSMGQLPTDRLERFNSNITTDFGSMVPKGGMTIGVIKDHVGVFVRALESIGDTMVLANPKVLALNKQKAQVIVGRRDGYLTTTVTETQAIQTVEFLETGTQLIFRPFIGDDGFIRMELHPEDSVGTVANGLPSEQTTEVTTNVMVRDGQTILIGGLFREVTADTRSQIPLLGNIPVLGAAFQGRSDTTERQEVIILLTVHLVKDQDAYARAGEKMRQDIERMRVGLRKHLMWGGRERLAQAYYRKSLEHFANGDSDKALWDVKMALYNYPRFISAVELKEEILGMRDWDDDGAAGRNFIYRIIMQERSIKPPDYDRAAPPFVSPGHLRGPGGFEEGNEQGGLNDAP
ncbi:MAG: hypothetical protein KAV82_06190 [Phycisphaerae bacterium]|nr:hypothetical protein [Phycisphaerae bacterium]